MIGRCIYLFFNYITKLAFQILFTCFISNQRISKKRKLKLIYQSFIISPPIFNFFYLQKFISQLQSKSNCGDGICKTNVRVSTIPNQSPKSLPVGPPQRHIGLLILHRQFQPKSISGMLFEWFSTQINKYMMKESNTGSSAGQTAKMTLILLFVLSLVGLSVKYYIENNGDIPPIVAFDFDTYCPINTQSKLNLINAELKAQGISALDFDFKVNSNIFVVNAQARPSIPGQPNSSALLYYCGIARKWWETSCDNARFVCSVPGPMFYFNVREEATIIWVNSIDFSVVNYNQTSCYASDSADHDCMSTMKPQSWGSCTYFTPTDYQYNAKQHFRVNPNSVPISPHIHGMEIRPAYDGNPLSWFTGNGQRGSGFQSLYSDSYFSLFKNQDTFKGKRPWGADLEKRTKVIKVKNNDLPGLLFYHDHAMKSTLYNVQFGLGGLWVIRDPDIEADLPKGIYEKFIVFSKQGDARTTLSPDAMYHNAANTEFERSATYRFRILNAAFDNSFNNVVFAAYYSSQVIDGKTVYTQIDPSNPQYDLNENKHIIPFSVIGTDTTLFHESIDNVDYANFGPAQRLDALIRFDTELPSNINNVYFVCDDLNEGKTVIKYQLNIQPAAQTFIEKVFQVLPNKNNFLRIGSPFEATSERLKSPKDYKSLRLPYTNLSNIPDSEIAVKRHRPLFSLPRDMRFMIGAHYMFEDGKSDQPKIGTVQDFYLINNLWEDHPMHIHLINHQVVKGYRLKQLPENSDCTLYFLDFLRFSGIEEFQGLNNVELCNNVWNKTDQQILDLFERLLDYMPEDKIEETEHGRVTGLDVMALSKGDENYLVGNCDFDSTHKYICGDISNEILEYERRWKDTSMVHKFSVFVLRARWTSTSYDPHKRPYPFFNIPEEQLVEFPGFVYHCHILPHQDNQMMRSFTLQHSDVFKAALGNHESQTDCSRRTWWDQMKCINDRLGCPMTA